MQIKATNKITLHTHWDSYNLQDRPQVGGETEFSHIAGESVKCTGALENSSAVFQKVKYIVNYTYDMAIPLLYTCQDK